MIGLPTSIRKHFVAMLHQELPRVILLVYQTIYDVAKVRFNNSFNNRKFERWKQRLWFGLIHTSKEHLNSIAEAGSWPRNFIYTYAWNLSLLPRDRATPWPRTVAAHCGVNSGGYGNLVNPFPHNDTFWRPCETGLFETLWEKEKLLVTSNFSFTHCVFYPFG